MNALMWTTFCIFIIHRLFFALYFFFLLSLATVAIIILKEKAKHKLLLYIQTNLSQSLTQFFRSAQCGGQHFTAAPVTLR